MRSLDYARQKNIDIVNMSIWWESSPINNPVCDSVRSLTNSWIIVVSSSWNQDIDVSNFVPWWCTSSITVWAYSQNRSRASFSNYWTKVDVSAPWVWVYSTYPNNRYQIFQWTSMAAPHIAWLISILKSYDSKLNYQQIKELLKDNSTKIASETSKPIWWWVNVSSLLSSYISEDGGVKEEVPKKEETGKVKEDNLEENILPIPEDKKEEVKKETPAQEKEEIKKAPLPEKDIFPIPEDKEEAPDKKEDIIDEPKEEDLIKEVPKKKRGNYKDKKPFKKDFLKKRKDKTPFKKLFPKKKKNKPKDNISKPKKDFYKYKKPLEEYLPKKKKKILKK